MPIKLFLLTSMVLLTACASGPQVRNGGSTASQSRDAQMAYQSGRYAQAARLWQQAAAQSQNRQSHVYRLRAADAWLLAGELQQTQTALEWIDSNALSNTDRAWYALLSAELALAQGNLQQAKEYLFLARADLNEQLANRYLDLQARIDVQNEDPNNRSLAKAIDLSRTYQGYDPEMAVALLRNLDAVSSQRLMQLATAPAQSPAMQAWLELAVLYRQYLFNLDGIEDSAIEWLDRHSVLGINDERLVDLYSRYRESFTYPQRIAVVLPTEGRLSNAGNAVRDGIISAYMDEAGLAQVQFYSSDESARSPGDYQSAVAAYFQAVDDGTDWIIGPLHRNAVQSIFNLAGLDTPILALNQPESTENIPLELLDQTFNIALLAEEEAASAALKALEGGLQRAAIIVPDNDWGERIANAFFASYTENGGRVTQQFRYNTEEKDHGNQIKQILGINASVARKRQLQSTLNLPLEFEPTSHPDFDMIFLGANPTQGRLIKPQLRFHDAGEIPVFSTGRIFNGRINPKADQDLDGVFFPISPWQLENIQLVRADKIESLNEGSFATLFALGMDAFQVLPWLSLMSSDPAVVYSGASGDLFVTENGHISRQPGWARFRRGLPVPYPQRRE